MLFERTIWCVVHISIIQSLRSLNLGCIIVLNDNRSHITDLTKLITRLVASPGKVICCIGVQTLSTQYSSVRSNASVSFHIYHFSALTKPQGRTKLLRYIQVFSLAFVGSYCLQPQPSSVSFSSIDDQQQLVASDSW